MVFIWNLKKLTKKTFCLDFFKRRKHIALECNFQSILYVVFQSLDSLTFRWWLKLWSNGCSVSVTPFHGLAGKHFRRRVYTYERRKMLAKKFRFLFLMHTRLEHP